MAVKAEWKKTGIYLEHDLGDGKIRRRTFNGVNADDRREDRRICGYYRKNNRGKCA